MLGPRENKNTSSCCPVKHRNEELLPAGLGHRVEGMRNRLCRRNDPNLYRLRIIENPASECTDVLGHSRGEEQRLPLLRHLADNPANIREEAHIAHAVGLIEDQYLHVREIQRACVDVIEQPPWAGNYDFYSSA